jgi:hypothetical protein
LFINVTFYFFPKISRHVLVDIFIHFGPYLIYFKIFKGLILVNRRYDFFTWANIYYYLHLVSVPILTSYSVEKNCKKKCYCESNSWRSWSKCFALDIELISDILETSYNIVRIEHLLRRCIHFSTPEKPP